VARLLKKMGTFEKLDRVKAGASIDEVLAEAAKVGATESESEEPLPTEAEIATEESADEVDEPDVADDEVSEKTGGEEEDEAV